MQILDRLKLELSNQKYFSDSEYGQFLSENDLDISAEYVKADMQKQLLNTVVDILEAVANDINTMRTISTSFSNIGEAYQFIEARIQQVKDKISAIPEAEEERSDFSLIFTRGKNAKTTTGTGTSESITSIPNSMIDAWFAEE